MDEAPATQKKPNLVDAVLLLLLILLLYASPSVLAPSGPREVVVYEVTEERINKPWIAPLLINLQKKEGLKEDTAIFTIDDKPGGGEKVEGFKRDAEGKPTPVLMIYVDDTQIYSGPLQKELADNIEVIKRHGG